MFSPVIKLNDTNMEGHHIFLTAQIQPYFLMLDVQIGIWILRMGKYISVHPVRVIIKAQISKLGGLAWNMMLESWQIHRRLYTIFLIMINVKHYKQWTVGQNKIAKVVPSHLHESAHK